MFSYAEVETVMASAHGQSPDQQVGAFRARLKHLKRLGVPVGQNPGRGKKIEYSREHFYQVALSLELTELGVDPAEVASTLEHHWPSFFRKMFEDAEQHDTSGADDLFMYMLPDSVSVAVLGADGQSTRRSIPNWGSLPMSKLRESVVEMARSYRRIRLLNVSFLVRLAQNVEKHLTTQPTRARGSSLAAFVQEMLEAEKYHAPRGHAVQATSIRPARSGFEPPEESQPNLTAEDNPKPFA